MLREEKELLLGYAQEALKSGGQERTEVLWLKERYERFRREMGFMSRQETDNLIYEKMYGASPVKLSDTLKIRYWRTGRHVPGNRETLLAFARALKLSVEEKRYLLQAYYDKADLVFAEDADDSIYRERRARMERLLQEYFLKAHPEKLYQVKISSEQLEKNLRHLYYTDALRYVHTLSSKPEKSHLISVNYGTELNRTLRLVGEIPRTTMIRHLILFGSPFLSRDIINEHLSGLGYLPLTKEHSMAGGERLDRLLLLFLALYEKKCRGKNPLECQIWLQEGLRIFDACFAAEGKETLRFMYFKALRD